METFTGYMVEADWDGETLRARGTNKAGQVALRGQERREGDVVLTRAEMERVTFKDANPVVNGNLVIWSTYGQKYQLHFRRKQREGFRRLAEQLGAVVSA